jgi:hypothetical protein
MSDQRLRDNHLAHHVEQVIELCSLYSLQTISHGYVISEVAQGTLATLNGARRPTWEPSVAVSHPFSDRLSAYVEYAPSLLQDHSLLYVLDGGLMLVRNKTRQFDVRAGYLADSNGIHTLIGVGYSVRYDSFFSHAHL